MTRIQRCALASLAMVISACVPPPPASQSAYTPTRVDSNLTELAQDGTERFARNLTYRVRNLSCDGLGSGSAFAISSDLLVTNRHVIGEGTRLLELSTWDGRDVAVDVAATAVWADIAVVSTRQELPVIADLGEGVEPGERIAAVGYPLGGPWSLSDGKVIDVVDAYVFDQRHPVIRFDADIAPGSSGGPLLDGDGSVAGVVFAMETTGAKYGLAIPLSTLADVLERDTLSPATSTCQSDITGSTRA